MRTGYPVLYKGTKSVEITGSVQNHKMEDICSTWWTCSIDSLYIVQRQVLLIELGYKCTHFTLTFISLMICWNKAPNGQSLSITPEVSIIIFLKISLFVEFNHKLSSTSTPRQANSQSKTPSYLAYLISTTKHHNVLFN